jgi:D-cysteine desulfhydrase
VTTLGFVNAALELAEQVERGDLPRPDAVFAALGTAGTSAGLALGLALAGMGDVALHAVRIVGGAMSTGRRMRALLGRTARLLGEAPRTCRVEVEEAFLGPGYARPTRESRAAQAWAAPVAKLDASYVAKAAACLLARRSAYRSPLLWLTG